MAQPDPLFIISRKQMRSMSGLVADEFVIACRAFLRENFKELAGSSDDELDAQTGATIEFAKHLGFHKEMSVQRLLAMRHVFGMTPKTHIPEVHLRDITVTTDEEVRLDHLERLLSDGHIK